MRFSFMSFSCPEADFAEFVAIAGRYGYDGIEPRIDAGHRHGIEVGAPDSVLANARKIAEDSGIKICCVATGCMYADPAKKAENVIKTKGAIELAAALGCPAIRVFGGQIPENITREESMASIVSALTEVSGLAGSKNVTVCLETHDSWCDPKDALKIIESVNSPVVAVNWDIMHPVLSAGYKMEDAFNVLKGRIRHVHIHDGVKEDGALKFLPVGDGAVDHKTALRLLRECGYGGFASGEWIGWEPYEVHLPREIATLKSL